MRKARGPDQVGRDNALGELVENGNGDRTREPQHRLGGLLAALIFGIVYTLAVASLIAVIVWGTTWSVPSLIGFGLVVGATLGFLPALLYQRDAKLAEAALEAIAAEVPEQVLLDAWARDPDAFARISDAEKLGALAGLRKGTSGSQASQAKPLGNGKARPD